MGVIKCQHCGEKFLSSGYSDDVWCSTECYLAQMQQEYGKGTSACQGTEG